MRILVVFILAFWATLSSANETSSDADKNTRIQLLGDSLMATHTLTGRSIPNVLSHALSEPISNRSMTGAMLGSISRQYEAGDYDWVVLNGGGNDLWLGCGCSECDARMSRMISEDGSSGMLPELVSKIRADGAQVLYVGYLRSPGFGSPIEHCLDEGNEFERRIETMARAEDGVWLLSNKQLVPSGDKSFHSFDRIHPSVKGSRFIGLRIASVINQLEAREE